MMTEMGLGRIVRDRFEEVTKTDYMELGNRMD